MRWTAAAQAGSRYAPDGMDEVLQDIADELGASVRHAVLAVPSAMGHQRRHRLHNAATAAGFVDVDLINATRAGVAARARAGTLGAGPGLWIDAQPSALSVLVFTAGPGVRLIAHGGTLHEEWPAFAVDIVNETLDRAALDPAQLEQVLVRTGSAATLLQAHLPTQLLERAVRVDSEEVARGCAAALTLPREVAPVGVGIEAENRSGPYLRLLLRQGDPLPARRQVVLTPVRAQLSGHVHLYEGNGGVLSQARRITTLETGPAVAGDRFLLEVRIGEDGLVAGRVTPA